MNDMQNAPPALPSRGPASIHCSSSARVDESAELGAVLGEGVAHGRDAFVPGSVAGATGHGATRSHHRSPPPEPDACRPALARIQRRKSAERVGHGRLHRVERRPADGVGEQRGVERVVPLAAPVDDRRLALDRVHRRGARHGDLRPRHHLGVVGGLPDGADRRRWRGRARPASAGAACPSAARPRQSAGTSRRVAGSPTPSTRPWRARRRGPPPTRSSGGRSARRAGAAGRRARPLPCCGRRARSRPSLPSCSALTQSASRASNGSRRASMVHSSANNDCARSSRLSVLTVA